MLALVLTESVDGALLNRRLSQHGLVAGFKTNTFHFLPPLTIQESDIDILTGQLDELPAR